MPGRMLSSWWRRSDPSRPGQQKYLRIFLICSSTFIWQINKIYKVSLNLQIVEAGRILEISSVNINVDFAVVRGGVGARPTLSKWQTSSRQNSKDFCDWWSAVVSTALYSPHHHQASFSPGSRHWRDLRCATLRLGESGRDVTPVSTMLRTLDAHCMTTGGLSHKYHAHSQYLNVFLPAPVS